MTANSIRPACDDDLERILEIEVGANPRPWTRTALTAELNKPHAHFWVVTDDENDETIFAFAIFQLVGDQAHLLEIAVDARVRKHGFGGQLVRAIINFTLRHSGESVYLEVRKSNANAVAFYQHLGFVVVDTKSAYYSDGEDAYAMCFRLKHGAAGDAEEKADA